MRIQPRTRTALVDAAAGRIPCDLIIQNTNMVNVFTGEIYKANIGIYDGFIAHVQADPDGLGRDEIPLEGKAYYDANGAYAIPGFIDSHIHIESSLATPRNFAREAVVHGTTTIVSDPHEMGNVMGIDGIKYMHECSEDLPMRQYILAASCVPAVPGLEHAGATFGPKEIEELLELERVIGLGEVMDYIGVINNSPRMVNIIDAVERRNMFIQGHAFCIHGRDLSAYACGGPMSDHESICAQDARDRLRIGMVVDARHSTTSQDVAEIAAGTMDFRYRMNMSISTDDTKAIDLVERGNEYYVIRQAIEAGMDPVDAIKIGTLNGALEIGITNLGAIAPGFVADLQLVDSLQELTPSAVFYGGRLVAKNGKLVEEIKERSFAAESINTVNLPPMTTEDFRIKAPVENGPVSVRVIKFNPKKKFLTEWTVEEIPVKDGYLDISQDPDLKYAININRHGLNTYGKCVVRGYGTNTGTTGSTVAHDSHNLIMVYDTPENALLVIDDLKKMHGGYSCAKNGEILARIALPVGGLMSTKTIPEIVAETQQYMTALNQLGLVGDAHSTFIMQSLSLPVIPAAKVTDMGVVDTWKQEFVDIFAV